MKVGSYSFDTLLHTSASTLVYAGVHDGDGSQVVAKLAANGSNLAHEFLVLEKIAGPGVVEALGLFDSSDGRVLIQRRFGSGTLADALHAGPISVPRALRIALQLAQVCARIHAARFIHRDLAPINILHDAKRDTIALGDMGAAAELPVNARALPVGDFIGTPAYVSPEHTGRMAGGCDARSDLYSLGATLYALLTGGPPFAERELLELIASHLSKAPEPPDKKVASIPPVVSDIVMKLLAKQPDERYQSARGLAADLERCIQTVKRDGQIPAFELGRSDLVRPRLPQRLFGRDGELSVLREALARAGYGTPQLVLISGREGGGRSELLRELVHGGEGNPLAIGGWTAPSDRPLAGLADALATLADQLLLLDEDRLSELRGQFAARLGQIGRIILDIAPALADVFGPQPALTEVSPEAARARLHHAFRSFIAALGDGSPAVLVLRGFQHADPATASLVAAILGSATSCRVVIALIANEPSAFGALRGRAGAVSIELPPLPETAVTDWIAAALDCDLDRAASLGEVLHAKAGGNPLMLARLVEHLVEIGAIARRDGAYVWSLDEISAAPPPLTLGGLAAQRITELDPVTRRTLAAIACSDEPIDGAALAAAAGEAPVIIAARAASLERDGLLSGVAGGYRVADPVIAEAALAQVTAGEASAMRGRLGAHLLAAIGPAPTGPEALRVGLLLVRGEVELSAAERLRAAELCAIAGEHVLNSSAYDAAANLFERAGGLVDDEARAAHAGLVFRIDMGRVRTLMMRGKIAEAHAQFEAMSARPLPPSQIGVMYASWCDSYSMIMERNRAIDVGLAGLERLGIQLPATPRPLRPLAAIRLNQRYLRKLSTADHLLRPEATDERALAAMKILSTITIPAVFTGRAGLSVLITETAIGLILRRGHMRNTSGFLASHACFLHVLHGDYAEARRLYEACDMLETARPAPELVARTAAVLHYTLATWFGSWQHAAVNVARAIRLGVEGGDPVFAALCASASVTMLFLTGAALDRIVAAIEGWGPFLRGDGATAALAANVTNICGKLIRGESIAQADLDRLTAVPLAAGSMRNSPMVNLGLALLVIGHAGQVRAWLDEIRDRFPLVNFSQPHRMTLWLLDGLLAASDARTAVPDQRAERRREAERILGIFHMLKRETQTTNNDAAIALIEAQLARADGELDRAMGLFSRAAREARIAELNPLIAYANEQRAELLDEAGFAGEATLFRHEAVVAYRRWSHMTKVAELEQAYPELRARELVRGDDARRTQAIPSGDATSPAVRFASATVQASTLASTMAMPTLNDRLDLATVLKVSQDISMQLTGSGVVRAVLTGVAQNAGAERAVFVLRAASGVETVYGELHGGVYRDIGAPLDAFPSLPRSVMRVVRRTGRPLVVADAHADPGHASDPFVLASRCRSLAGIPVRRGAEIAGFVVLENRMVAGAFTPQLVSLTQALVAQAAISLDNASLYQNLEDLVAERTAALTARTIEMRMVLDHVAQGLVVAGIDGQLANERSAIFATWFPDGVPDALAELFAGDAGAAAWFDLVWDQLVNEVLPLDLALAQMPRQLRLGERMFALDWQPICGETGRLERMLVVLSDVTESMRRVEAEREQTQLMAMLQALSEDRSGVVEFFAEASSIVAELARGAVSVETEKRLLHTLKGNAALFGLAALAARCHDIENAMAVDARGISSDERRDLAAAWQVLHDKLARFVDVSDGFLQVRRADYDQMVAQLRRDRHPALDELELWVLEPFRTRLERIGEQACALAERLGKQPVEVQIDHGGLYLDSAVWAAFWSAFAHVVRNAIDHGLEPPDERAQLGKGPSTLRLRSYLRGSALVLELSDDGRGIAWDALRDRARAAGLPADSRADLVAAMFHDGITTRSDVSELSGRGVGLGALAEVCRQMGCEISVDSAPGQGTTWRFELPAQLGRARRGRPVTREPVVVSLTPP